MGKLIFKNMLAIFLSIILSYFIVSFIFQVLIRIYGTCVLGLETFSLPDINPAKCAFILPKFTLLLSFVLLLTVLYIISRKIIEMRGEHE